MWLLLRYLMFLVLCRGYSSLRNHLMRRPAIFARVLAYNLLLDTPIKLRNIDDIIDRYDIFLLDQFGVLHDGKYPIPGAVSFVEKLKSLNKKIVLVSNTSQRSNQTLERFYKLGFPVIDGAVTSGDTSASYLRANLAGKKIFVFTWSDPDNLLNFFQDIPDVYIASSLIEADCLLFHGSQIVHSTGEDIELFSSGRLSMSAIELLEEAVRQDLPAICCNLDQRAYTSEGLRYMPGLLKDAYEEMGGRVVSFGKPFEVHFEAALTLAGGMVKAAGGGPRPPRRPRVVNAVHFGDSIEHDIRGAAAAGIDSVLLTAYGVHRDELHSDDSRQIIGGKEVTEASPSPASLLFKVCDECDRLQVARPTFILAKFESQ